jgi:hypothetical protein
MAKRGGQTGNHTKIFWWQELGFQGLERFQRRFLFSTKILILQPQPKIRMWTVEIMAGLPKTGTQWQEWLGSPARSTSIMVVPQDLEYAA